MWVVEPTWDMMYWSQSFIDGSHSWGLILGCSAGIVPTDLTLVVPELTIHHWAAAFGCRLFLWFSCQVIFLTGPYGWDIVGDPGKIDYHCSKLLIAYTINLQYNISLQRSSNIYLHYCLSLYISLSYSTNNEALLSLEQIAISPYHSTSIIFLTADALVIRTLSNFSYILISIISLTAPTRRPSSPPVYWGGLGSAWR